MNNFKTFISEAATPDPAKSIFGDLKPLYDLVMLSKTVLAAPPCNFNWLSEDKEVMEILEKFQEYAYHHAKEDEYKQDTNTGGWEWSAKEADEMIAERM